jgi:hypothetical protein
MRIKSYTLVISMLALIGLASCEDVINSDPNFKRKYPDSSNTRKDIYFRFWADDLNYNLLDTTKLFETTKPSSWGLNFYVVNNTADSNYVLKSVKLEKGNYFSLWSISQLPYELEPYQTINNKSFVISLVVDTLELGTYIDMIIVNNYPELIFYIRVKVK